MMITADMNQSAFITCRRVQGGGRLQTGHGAAHEGSACSLNANHCCSRRVWVAFTCAAAGLGNMLTRCLHAVTDGSEKSQRLQSRRAETLVAPEAEVEDAGSVRDRPGARVLPADLQDERRPAGFHSDRGGRPGPGQPRRPTVTSPVLNIKSLANL